MQINKLNVTYMPGTGYIMRPTFKNIYYTVNACVHIQQ